MSEDMVVSPACVQVGDVVASFGVLGGPFKVGGVQVPDDDSLAVVNLQGSAGCTVNVYSEKSERPFTIFPDNTGIKRFEGWDERYLAV